MTSKDQPLEGLRVLDFGHYIAGPLAGVYLADQGADVISVVQPDKSSWAVDVEQILARGKRALPIDLKDPAGLERAAALAQGCDVLIENFRPGVMDRLGLGYDAVRRTNTDVVYVSLPAYSRHDPRAQQKGYDSTISAACGLFTDLSLAGAAAGVPPTYTPLALPSTYAGLWGAIAATSAMYARLMGGGGDHIEVPLMDAAMSAAAGALNMAADQPARYNTPPLSRRLLDAVSLSRSPRFVARAAHRIALASMPAGFRSYRCKDERQLFLCVADNAAHTRNLLEVTGLSAAARAAGLVEGDVFDIPATGNNLNAYRGTSRPWRRFAKELEAVFATQDAQVWAERLNTAGVPAAIHQSTADWAAMPAMVDAGVVRRQQFSEGDVLVCPGPQVDVRGPGLATAPSAGAARRADAGSVIWSQDRRFVPSDIPSSVTNPGAPLAGVRVVDFSNVIAGPAAARVMAELGAQVTHVSPVAPEMGPRQTMLFGLDVHQGKRDIAIDLRSEPGQRFLEAVLPSSDVVLYNKLPVQAQRLGLAPEQVHRINDAAIVTAVTAYGGVDGGAWQDRPAYDPVVQALAGIMQRFGTPEAPQVHGIASCIDYFTGFSAALATIIGLIVRAQGHTSLSTRTSLGRTAGWVQLLQLNGEVERTRGPSERGPDPFDRIYRTRDGWLHLRGHPSALTDGSAATDSATACRRIAAEVRWRSTTRAIHWASRAGMTAQPVLSARVLRRSAAGPRAAGDLIDVRLPSGRLLRQRHPAGEEYTTPDALWLRPSEGRRQLASAPSPGQHTGEILAELGYDEDSVAQLLREGAVAEAWFTADRYLPR